MTIQEIISAHVKNGGRVENHPLRENSFLLSPPMKLRHEGLNQIVSVDALDENGPAPESVHVQYLNMWRPARHYGLPILNPA